MSAVCCVVATVVVYVLYRLVDAVYRRPMIDCRGLYVFITGCDSGFGNALARRLDGKGCHVIATCLTDEGEKQLRGSCSDRLKTIRMNVADESSVRSGFEAVKNILPSDSALWGVVNNAGIAGSANGPMEWLTIDNYMEVIEVNTLAVVNVAMTLLPFIKKSKGRIVNMASILGRLSLPLSLPYNCSKYGVEAFSDGLRRQLIDFGCSVHIIEPGYHRTNILNRKDNEQQLRRAWDQTTPEIKEEFGPEYLEKAVASLLDKAQQVISKRIDDVIDAYEHALFAKRPRARYVIGNDANYFFLPVQWLPEWIGDWILEFSMRAAPKPAACRHI